MTKKEFKERSSIHTYGRGKRRTIRLYFDWNSNKDGVGFSKMLEGFGVTKARLFADAYDIIIKENYDALCWYNFREAKFDSDRFKVSLTA